MTAEEAHWMPAWLALLRTHAKLMYRAEAQMRRDHGLTVVRYDVLANLDLAGGRAGIGELASLIVLSPSGLSKLLDRVEASGLIRHEPDPDDARSTFATLTPRGRALVRKVRTAHHDFLAGLIGEALDNRDADELVRILTRLQAHLDT